MPTVVVPLAPGFEEIEALTVVDILRRADVKVITAGTIDGPIGCHQIEFVSLLIFSPPNSGKPRLGIGKGCFEIRERFFSKLLLI